MSSVRALHDQAMARVDDAFAAKLRGQQDEAAKFLHAAFELERAAATEVAPRLDAEPTRSILHRSAASLAIDCGELRDAERLVCTALQGEPPADIAEELRDLLEQVYFRRHMDIKGITLDEGDLQLSISGPAVGYGVVEADQFLGRVGKTETLIFRTAERHLGKSFRERGQADKSVRANFGFFIQAPRAASLAVTIKLGRLAEQPSFVGMDFTGDVLDDLLTCLDLFQKAEDERLKRIIKDAAYLRNFLALTKQIAPDGNEIRQVGFALVRGEKRREVALTKQERTPRPIRVRNTAKASSVVVTGELREARSRKGEKGHIE
ncbi:MAG: hypothetical protein ACREDR_37075, partial [Blastocatellia bacterium]